MGGASRVLMLLSTPFPRLSPLYSLFRLVRHSQAPSTSLAAVLTAPHRLLSSSFQPRHGSPPIAAKHLHTQASVGVDCGESSVSTAGRKGSSHPWPEWLKLVEHLTAGGYVDRQVYPAVAEDDDSFSVSEELPEEFRRLAGACLLYARERPDLLRYLSKKDIEIVVENGSPFLFKNALNSVRRMKSFIGNDGNEVLHSEQAHTVDMMRYLLSYARNSFSSTADDTRGRELVESSVRCLLFELVKINGGTQESCMTDTTARHTPFGYEQSRRNLRQNIEMKRGDWICPKCNFMNFARNLKCLECDEARPKGQLTGGEWECPQCDFFNYSRNMTCLRCDCKRPGETSSSRRPTIEQLLNSGNVDRAEIERRLAENDEKAERWFSKVSQLDDSSDLSSAIAEEDFPEIMPLRKGTNRFVISTRKTPLERRLANAQYRSNLGNDNMGKMGSDKMSESAINQTLDRILGRSSATSGTNQSAESGTSTDAGHQSIGGEPSTTGNIFTCPESRNSGFVPFVQSSADTMCKKPSTEVQQASDKLDFASMKSDHLPNTVSRGFGSGKANEYLPPGDLNNPFGNENVNNQVLSKTTKDSSDPIERWPKNSAEFNDVPSLQGATSSNDLDKVPPMYEEESRFAVNNKRDHSLTALHYKRRIAMDQSNNSNFVPFVPFPPDYFAKKDRQPEAGSSTDNYPTSSSASVAVVNEKSIPRGFEENRMGYSYQGGANNIGQTGSSIPNGDSGKSGLSGTNSDSRRVAQPTNNVWNNNSGSGGSFAQEVNANGVNSNRLQVGNAQKPSENWNHGFPGKSLEGSAVTEPDPLDMSEEAKAQRWFRRVAQIKDISELSKIPDEDFPEIMPMRKGVNRFVVSKRKTPLERRLTSAQYRRNLPIVSSEPGKDSTRE